jgi:hypothetical protein
VGTFGSLVTASDSFPFTKTGTLARGAGASSGGWQASGWEETWTASAGAALPGGFTLSEVYPNPFGSQARLMLEVAEAQAVHVEVYDVLGRRVAVLHEGFLPQGLHAFTIEGAGLPSGTYTVRATGERSAATQRLTRAR